MTPNANAIVAGLAIFVMALVARDARLDAATRVLTNGQGFAAFMVALALLGVCVAWSRVAPTYRRYERLSTLKLGRLHVQWSVAPRRKSTAQKVARMRELAKQRHAARVAAEATATATATEATAT